jgi:hypothetical protein
MKEFQRDANEKSISSERADERSAAASTPVVERSTFRRHPIRWMIAAGLAFLLLCGLAALITLAHILRHGETYNMTGTHMMTYDNNETSDGNRSGRGYSTPHVDGTTVQGVVTAITADGFTVAGNGMTKEVKTNGSTIFNTANNKVAVNDTVRVSGVTSGDSFTATRVMVENR